MDAVGIVACSNAQKEEKRKQNEDIIDFLKNTGKNVFISNCIYEKDTAFSGSGKERAEELMKMFLNPDITEIYDISGGDMANEILCYLDYDAIAKSNAVFWGYSDLTVILNAIYKMTGKSSVLYQIRNISHDEFKETQRKRFINRSELFNPSFRFIQGECVEGTVIGGNIRCFLKLAGTKYFPDFNNKVLLLEACSGNVPQMVTYLSQLKLCGVFKKIQGIILGTFSEMQDGCCDTDIASLVRYFAGEDIPIVKTEEIGHGFDSKAIFIGEEIRIEKLKM